MMASNHQGPLPPRVLAWRRFRRHRPAGIALWILVLLALAALGAPWISPYPFDLQNLDLGAVSPSAAHWLGTDDLGRDLLSRLLYGSRISLAVGFCATWVSLLIGVTYGALSGYAGGRTDHVMMRGVDVLYAMPFTAFVIILTVVFGRNLLLLFVAIGGVEWLTMARITRGQVMAIKNESFVRAARVLDYSHGRILGMHIVPNILGPVIVYTTLTVPRVILLESFLSFLGLGVQPPMSSWGLLIRDGARMMESYPWMLLFPGMILSVTLLALNLVGDALRDALDPRAPG